jgi:hypothetical protein
VDGHRGPRDTRALRGESRQSPRPSGEFSKQVMPPSVLGVSCSSAGSHLSASVSRSCRDQCTASRTLTERCQSTGGHACSTYTLGREGSVGYRARKSGGAGSGSCPHRAVPCTAPGMAGASGPTPGLVRRRAVAWAVVGTFGLMAVVSLLALVFPGRGVGGTSE